MPYSLNILYNYRSINDLSLSIRKNLYKIPENIDLIVGIPRSGMLAANIIALLSNKQLTDLSGFYEDAQLYAGSRLSCKINKASEAKNVLVVDDSVYSGASLDKVKEKVKKINRQQKITYCAIYSIEKSNEALWLSTNGGLSKYSFKSEIFENFNTSDGLQSLEYNSGASYTNNNRDVYFGGINGYNIVRTDEGDKNTNPPRAYISSVNYKGKNLLELDSIDQSTNEKIIVIPHYRNSFSISVDALHFSSPKENVFKALTESKKLSKWYTTIVKGEFKLNEIINFEFVNFAEFKFKVTAITQNESVHLEVVESEFDNVGHIMKYELDENDGKTRVRYTYEGFAEMDDSYANMNYSSAKYLESLRQYCQTGNGEAFGSSSYRA